MNNFTNQEFVKYSSEVCPLKVDVLLFFLVKDEYRGYTYNSSTKYSSTHNIMSLNSQPSTGNY